MATSGTLTKYFTGDGVENLCVSTTKDDAAYSLTLNWQITDTDVVNSISTVSWTLSATAIDFNELGHINFDFGTPSYLVFGTDKNYVYYPYDPYKDIVVKLGSDTVYSATDLSVSLYAGETKQIASGTFNATHDTNGNFSDTLTCTVRLKNIYDENGIYGYASSGYIDVGNKSEAKVSGTITLDYLPKYAVIQSAPDFTDEDSPTITFAIPNGATNVRAYISFSTSTIDIGSYAVSGSSYTFNFTDEEKEKLWSILDEGLTTKSVYFYVMSDYQGTTYYSSLIRTLTVINYTPTIAPEVYDTNEDAIALTGDSFKLIRYVSNAYWKTGAQARKGATLETQLVNVGGKTYYGASGTIEGITSPSFAFSAIDSYGRSVSSNYNVALATGYWIEYIKLTCSATSTEMTADGDVEITLKGKYFDDSFGAKDNQMRMSYDISKDGGDFEHVDKGYIYPTVDSEGNYTYSFTISELNYQSVYDITVRVSDEVAVEGTETQVIVASTPIFDWGRTDFNFNVPVTIQGGSVPTLIESGTYNSWNYRKWSDGVAECWRNLTVSTTISNTSSASWYSSGELSSTNLSYPFTFTAIPTVNVNIMPMGNTWAIVFPSNTACSTSNTGSYQLNSMSQATASKNYLLSYQVKGYWK